MQRLAEGARSAVGEGIVDIRLEEGDEIDYKTRISRSHTNWAKPFDLNGIRFVMIRVIRVLTYG